MCEKVVKFGMMLIVLLFCQFTYGKVIYVDDDAVGANDGTSWENAYIYLQDAFTDANSAEKPVEIHVAQGIYKPDHGAGITLGHPNEKFQLLNGVTVLGGFAGTSSIDPDTEIVYVYICFVTSPDIYFQQGFRFQILWRNDNIKCKGPPVGIGFQIPVHFKCFPDVCA